MITAEEAREVLRSASADVRESIGLAGLDTVLAYIDQVADLLRWRDVREGDSSAELPGRIMCVVKLEGFKEHSGALWVREAIALMPHWERGHEEATPNGWPLRMIEELCKKHDADMLSVIHWRPLGPGPE